MRKAKVDTAREAWKEFEKRYGQTRFELTCDPRVSKTEVRNLSRALEPYGVPVSQQCAFVEITTGGAIILAIAFVSKSLLAAFLSELGKDAYGWVKAQTVARRQKLSVRYSIQIGNVTVDARSDHRLSPSHCDTLFVAAYALSRFARPIDRIELKYDPRKRRYVSATAYAGNEKVKEPISLPPPPTILNPTEGEPNTPLHLPARTGQRAGKRRRSARRR